MARRSDARPVVILINGTRVRTMSHGVRTGKFYESINSGKSRPRSLCPKQKNQSAAAAKHANQRCRKIYQYYAECRTRGRSPPRPSSGFSWNDQSFLGQARTEQCSFGTPDPNPDLAMVHIGSYRAVKKHTIMVTASHWGTRGYRLMASL